MTDTRVIRITLVLAGLAVVAIGLAGAGAAQEGTIDAQGSPDISVFTPNNEVTPGDETEFTVQFSNDGNLRRGSDADREFVTTARSVVTTLDGSNTPITVTSGRKSVGKITESDPKDVGFDIVVPDGAEPGTYELTVEFAYSYTSRVYANVPTQSDIVESGSRSRTETVEIEISDDPRFKIEEIDDSLRVGEEGEITGQLRNVGGEDATSTEVSFAPESETVIALESSVAVGDVPAGESTEFSIPVEVTSEAEAVPRQFDLPVNFRDEDGIRQTDDDPEFQVNIGEQRDTFNIEPVDPTIEAGSTESLDVRVTNNQDETLNDIEGKFFADDPLDSSNDETFTTSLEPNETTTVTVDLSASEGATLKNYPVSMDFRYTDSEGDSKLTDSYRMAINVTEPSDDSGGLPLGPLVIGLVVVAGVGGVLWRRRGGESIPGSRGD